MIWRARRVGEKGFTLTELIISLVLLGLVLALGYQLFHHVNYAFREGEKQWMAQKEAQKIADWLDSALKNAYTVFIQNNTSYSEISSFSEDDEYIYVFEAEDQRVYFRNSCDTQPQLLADLPVTLRFMVESIDPASPEKELEYCIIIMGGDEDVLYEMSSRIHFANMLRSAGINLINGEQAEGTVSKGNMVKILNETEDLESIQLNISSCFIATAAYGAPDDMPVSILRQFRDRYLLTNSVGAAFVEFYYAHSPPLASFVADKPVLRAMVRILLLPAVLIAYMFVVPEAALLICYVLATSIWLNLLLRAKNRLFIY